MKLKDDKYGETVDRMTLAFGSRQRGECIAWQEIEGVMGLSRDDIGGRTIVHRFRRRLLRDHRIVTLCTREVGIRLLTNEQTAREITVMRQRKARRQINRCIRETDTVDGAALSDHDRLVLSSQRHNLKNERLQLGRSYREAEAAAKKTEVNPIRKIG
jgi:hypothetical protein